MARMEQCCAAQMLEAGAAVSGTLGSQSVPTPGHKPGQQMGTTGGPQAQENGTMIKDLNPSPQIANSCPPDGTNPDANQANPRSNCCDMVANDAEMEAEAFDADKTESFGAESGD